MCAKASASAAESKPEYVVVASPSEMRIAFPSFWQATMEVEIVRHQRRSVLGKVWYPVQELAKFAMGWLLVLFQVVRKPIDMRLMLGS